MTTAIHHAAAPGWVARLLAGPERSAAVVHTGADAVYLDLEGRCLGVLSRFATAVPCGLRTALDQVGTLVAGARSGVVGDGRLRLGHSEITVGRRVDAAVPPVSPEAAPALAAVLRDLLRGPAGDRLSAVRAELADEALSGLVCADPSAVPALLGRGSGLTPVGDDVLAGWLATCAAADALQGPAGRSGPTAVAVAVERLAPEATTLLSGTLLTCARHGDVLPQFRRLLLDLTHDRTASRARTLDSLETLLAVGHTSGAGMVLGTTLALRHLAARSSCP